MFSAEEISRGLKAGGKRRINNDRAGERGCLIYFRSTARLDVYLPVLIMSPAELDYNSLSGASVLRSAAGRKYKRNLSVPG